MLPRKAAQNVISIDSARLGPEPQPPSPVSAPRPRKLKWNQWTRRQALRQFFMLGSGVWKIQRETGLPTAEIENELRELGYAEWERQNRRAA